MLKTIIFDCDGVMFDSQNSNRHYYNSLLAHFGYPEMDEKELHYVHIHSVYDSVKHIFRNYPRQSIDQVHEYRKANSYLPFLKYMDMEADLLDFLQTTYNRYNLAIATNRSDTMMPLLQEFNLEHYFGKVMTADNSPRPKPAADPLLEIIKHYRCTIGEAVYIGDSSVDEETAKNCGMRLIAFKNTELDADFHVSSFTEILQLPIFE